MSRRKQTKPLRLNEDDPTQNGKFFFEEMYFYSIQNSKSIDQSPVIIMRLKWKRSHITYHLGRIT